MGLFETLTIPARHALAAATDVAEAMGSHEVEAAHLLVGLLDTPSVVQCALASRLDQDRERLLAEVQCVTLPSADGKHPAFGEEVCLVLAAARGISSATNAPATGTVAVLRGVLVLLPTSAEELLRHLDLDSLQAELGDLDDSGEPAAAPPGTSPWTVGLATGGPDGWDDTH